ncbi:glycoside hydrolase family 65 protein [Actinomycetospora sp. C-140]
MTATDTVPDPTTAGSDGTVLPGGAVADGLTLTWTGFAPDDEGLREALTSTGNGYFCTRGAAEWEDTDAPKHYAGTYAHGAYNRETTILGGRPVLNEDLVNLPNWLVLKLRIEGEEAIRLDNVEVLDYRHSYDIRSATASREFRFRDRAGRETTLRSRRFVSMAHSHQAAMEWTLTAENWSGRIGIVSAIDGRVDNTMVARYRDLEGRHLDPVTPRTFGPEIIALKVRTRQSNLYVSEAARTRIYRARGRGWERIEPARTLHQMNDYIQQVLDLDLTEGETVRVEKIVSFFTSHDNAITETLTAAGRHVERYPDFAGCLAEHVDAWDEYWDVADLEVPAEPRIQLLLRFHMAHVLQVCSRHTARHDAGVPARGLNGEAYRGHVFWDELYVYPFLNYRLPEITRGLLMYRYRRLAEARAAAAEAGYRGAMFPWQSGSDGTEETQVVHLNPLSGQWDPDHSHNQRHVNAAIFYNVWQYYQATDDLEFLRDYGAELMLEIARFWASIAHKDPDSGRYEIHGVMGPDEFHERYPGAEAGGLRNNAYTNVMVAWIAATAPKVLALLPKSRRRALRSRLGITDDEIARWSEMATSMDVPIHRDDSGHPVITQFEGYESLAELDWDGYRARHRNIQRMDRILKAEGDDPDHYKLAKQADAVMLFFLFTQDELREILSRLGYDEIASDDDLARRTVAYYDRRTSHGSTLSLVAHAAVLAGIDPESSWERFLVAVESDIGDVQGGTTKEGIHMGVMSGTLDLLQRAYLGASARDGVLHFAPRLTLRLDGLALSLVFQGTSLRVSVADGSLTVAVQSEGFSHPVRIGLGDEVRELGAGQEWTVSLDREGRVASSTAPAAVTAAPETAATATDGDGPLQSSTTSGAHDDGGNGA